MNQELKAEQRYLTLFCPWLASLRGMAIYPELQGNQRYLELIQGLQERLLLKFRQHRDIGDLNDNARLELKMLEFQADSLEQEYAVQISRPSTTEQFLRSDQPTTIKLIAPFLDELRTLAENLELTELQDFLSAAEATLLAREKALIDGNRLIQSRAIVINELRAAIEEVSAELGLPQTPKENDGE